MEKRMIDEIDTQIIKILSGNANITATEISGQISLSIPAVNKRIAKLVDSGVISQYTIIVDPDRAGKSLLAFILVVLERLTYAEGLIRCVQEDPDLLECYATTGEFDYIIKARAKNMLDLESKLIMLKEVQGVVKTNTMISLFTHKYLPSVLPDFE